MPNDRAAIHEMTQRKSLQQEGIFFLLTGGYNCLNDDTAFLEMNQMTNQLEQYCFNHIDSAYGRRLKGKGDSYAE
jgi:hypothetical protein